MIYEVKRNGKTLRINGNYWFETYNEARQALRAYVRKLMKQPAKAVGVKGFGFFDATSRNITRIPEGFKIVRA